MSRALDIAQDAAALVVLLVLRSAGSDPPRIHRRQTPADAERQQTAAEAKRARRAARTLKRRTAP